ncbi:MAG: class I SAM-dependent methyltransferase [Planctomycetota bacterium]|nr:MAG: class I SAM-dependent methyltransferase [Planctomycetota bacterium]
MPDLQVPPRRWIASIALLFLVQLVVRLPAAPAQEAAQADGSSTEEIPPAKPGYMGRKIATTMHYLGAPWLMRESRQREEDCETLLKALNVKPGQTVCDIGCGNGFYTLQLAKLVGEQGRVLAVDIQPEMLHMLEERAKEAGLTNIELIHGTQIDPKLEPNSVDLILLVDVYHEFSHPAEMLSAMREALKPEGRIALAEFRLEDASVPIKRLHKMSKKQIMKEFPANGLELAESFDELPWQHLMFFKRGEASP